MKNTNPEVETLCNAIRDAVAATQERVQRENDAAYERERDEQDRKRLEREDRAVNAVERCALAMERLCGSLDMVRCSGVQLHK